MCPPNRQGGKTMKPIPAFLMIFFVASVMFTAVLPAAPYDPEVYRVQKALRERGYDPGSLDGVWGTSTAGAVKRFQRDMGLPVTGRLDDRTRSGLGIISSDRSIRRQKEAGERRLALVIGNGDYNTPC